MLNIQVVKPFNVCSQKQYIVSVINRKKPFCAVFNKFHSDTIIYKVKSAIQEEVAVLFVHSWDIKQ